jgi:hypothetical protein
MSGYQEVTLNIREHHLHTLQQIAKREHGNQQQVEKVIFSALLGYFEARSTNELLEDAVREGLEALEEHVRVLLDLIKTLLVSASYDTSKIRVLLEFLFEHDIGADLIPELYKQTGSSVTERLREEDLVATAELLTEYEHVKRQLRDFEQQSASTDKKKQEIESKQQNRDREYAETVQRLTQQASTSEQARNRVIAWVNGLLTHLQQGGALQDYLAKHAKPDGVL